MVALFHSILLQEDECVQLLICITHHMNTLTDCSYCSATYMYTHTQIYTPHTLSCYTYILYLITLIPTPTNHATSWLDL